MRPELDRFLMALTFFTRIPSPVSNDSSQAMGSACYAPVIGWIVGAVASISFALSFVVLPLSVSVLISMAATILVTGGLHEDGWMDFCDGFGGGRDADQVLRIMRDSQSGAYAVLGAGMVLLLKFSILKELFLSLTQHTMLAVFAAILIAAHGLSRLCAVAFMYTQDYVGGQTLTKSQSMAKKMSLPELRVALIGGVLPVVALAALWNWRALFVLLPVSIIALVLGGMFQRRLGGYTGDCLGAVQQLTELGFYLGLYAVIVT